MRSPAASPNTDQRGWPRRWPSYAQRGPDGGGAFGYLPGGMELDPEESAAVLCGARGVLAGASLREVSAAWNAAGLTTCGGSAGPVGGAGRPRAAPQRRPGGAPRRRRRPGRVGADPDRQLAGVRAILLDPGRTTSPGNAPRWLCSGIATCPCGSPLVVGTSGKHRNPSYVCRAERVPGVKHATRQAHDLDHLVAEMVIGRLSKEDAREVFARPVVEVDRAALNAERAALEIKQEEMAAEFGKDPETTAAEYRKMRASGLARLKEIAAILAAAAVGAGPVTALALSEDVRAAWEDLTLTAQRAVVVELFDVEALRSRPGRRAGGLYFDPEDVRITLRGAGAVYTPPMNAPEVGILPPLNSTLSV